MAQNYNNSGSSSKKMGIIVIILAIIAGVLIFGYIYQRNEYNKLQKESEKVQAYLSAEKDSLENELYTLRDEYDALETANDTLSEKISLQRSKIERLLRINATNVSTLKEYKKEIGTLRSVLKDFVAQIDSLNQLNQKLMVENKEVKTELEETHIKKDELEKSKEELTTKVRKAEALAAKNIEAVGLNKRSKEKDKAEDIVKLRVCFTLRENAIAKSGERYVYLRIVRPDSTILTSSTENIITIDGNKIIYSAKRQVNYENQDISMCIYYDNKEGELMPGTYNVLLYSEGHLIGETKFTLKEGGFLFF
ncbi:MAG: coiled-coil domain-containing protein [Bacteroidota bacterium]